MHSGSAGRRVIRGISWTTLGNAASSASTFVASILVARMLGAKHFGEFGIIQNTLGFFALLAGPSLGITATKYVAELRNGDPERAGRVLKLASVSTYILSAVAALILVIGAPFIATHVLNAPHITAGLRLAAVALMFVAVNSLQMGVLTGFEAFKDAAIVNLVRGLLTFPSMWFGAVHFGYMGAVYALVIVWGASCAMSYVMIHRVAPLHGVSTVGKGFWKERGLLLSFSLPGWVSGLLIAIANWSTSAILTRQPNGLEQMGIFNAVNQIFLVLLFLPVVTGQASMPVLAERVGAGDRPTALKMLKHLAVLNAVITLPLCVVLAIMSRQIMGHLGEDYANQWPALIATLLAVVFYAESNIAGSVVTASGAMWVMCSVSAVYLVILVVTSVHFVPLGAYGLCLARLISYVAYAVFTFWQALRFVSPKRPGEG